MLLTHVGIIVKYSFGEKFELNDLKRCEQGAV